MVAETSRNASRLRRALRNTASNYLGKFLSVALRFLLTPFVLFQLGAQDYGLWALVGSVVAYGVLLDAGIWGAITRYVAAHLALGEIDQVRSLLATALRLYCLLAAIALACTLAIAPIFPSLFNVAAEQSSTSTWLVLLMGLGVTVSIPGNTPLAVLRGLQRFDLDNLLNTAGALISTAATVLVLLAGGGLLGMVSAHLLATLLVQAAGFLIVRRVAPELRLGWRGADRRYVRTILSLSTSIFVTNISTRLQWKTDEMVIAAARPISMVTPFAISRRLSDVVEIFTEQLMKVLLPLASELHAQQDSARLRQVFILGTRLSLVISAPIALVLGVLSGDLLGLWVGPEYSPYADLVAILVLARIFDLCMWPAGSILQATNRHRAVAISAVCSGLANVALSVVLLPSFGLVGVALGTLIPTAFEACGFVLPFTMRSLGVGPGEVLKEILLPALAPLIAPAALLYLVRAVFQPDTLLAIAVLAAGSFVMYGVIYLVLGASKFERELCHQALQNTTLRLGK